MPWICDWIPYKISLINYKRGVGKMSRVKRLLDILSETLAFPVGFSGARRSYNTDSKNV